ncbi:hypothetical protein J6590_047915 [Homalodisca vitripennis]|nr:hypothetical protein J6590_047915 [Homalodisca vitripennis]
MVSSVAHNINVIKRYMRHESHAATAVVIGEMIDASGVDGIIGDERKPNAPILIMHTCSTAVEHSNPPSHHPSLITSSPLDISKLTTNFSRFHIPCVKNSYDRTNLTIGGITNN